ncbi:MAG: chloride channel protein [Lachnospiraceae bacterium]|nr:chloride channel protein [Lachnospiraceae bacterium]
MNRQRKHRPLELCFAATTGALIAIFIWLYLELSNVGVTIIWDRIPSYIDFKYYTLTMCLVGGLVVGIFHHFYGPYPESMADAVRRVNEDGFYPFKNLHITVVAAFLSLFFGGSVGPESGLVCLLLGLCFWAMAQFDLARNTIQTCLERNPGASGGYMFRRMLRNLLSPANRLPEFESSAKWKRSEQITTGMATGVTALLIYLLMNWLFGSAFTIPHLNSGEIYMKDRFSVILLAAAGIGSGYLFLFFRKLTSRFFGKLRTKKLDIINAILGGLILGLIGTALPMTMFSGGSDIQLIQYEYYQYTPWLLILIGVVKLFLTNVCIESGWRGGHFFPVIFSGLSIGYGLSSLLGTSQLLSVIVVTAALLGTILQQPLGAFALTLVFFPIDNLGWMAAVCFATGCIPLPRALRATPENRGFIYGLLHKKEQKKLTPHSPA